MNLISIENALDELRLNSDCAFNGRVAIKHVLKRLKLEKPMYKLILLDYSMPGMDGPQVAQKIRKLLERSHINFGKYPFICCCTSYSQESFKR